MAQAIHRLSDEVEVLGLVALDHPLIRHAVARPPPAACACSPCFPICRSPSAAGISASIIIKPGAQPPGLSSAYAGGMAKLALSLAIIVLPARKAVRSAFAPACENRARGNRSLSRFAVMNGGYRQDRDGTDADSVPGPARRSTPPAAASKGSSTRCATAAVSRRSLWSATVRSATVNWP